MSALERLSTLLNSYVYSWKDLLAWLRAVKELMALSRMLGRSVVFFNASTSYVKVRETCPKLLTFDHQFNEGPPNCDVIIQMTALKL
jgi:hypothetical protein